MNLHYLIKLLFLKGRGNLLKSLVPSRPTPLIISFSPPGWNGKYAVTLYTFPFIAIHASFRRRCFLSSEGGIRRR
jgi:hypothetical protein